MVEQKTKHELYLEFVDEVFETAKKKLGFKSDAALARHLGENRGNIAKYRSGERLINDWRLLRLVKDAGMDMGEAIDFILHHKSLKEDAKEVLNTFRDLFKKDDPE